MVRRKIFRRNRVRKNALAEENNRLPYSDHWENHLFFFTSSRNASRKEGNCSSAIENPAAAACPPHRSKRCPSSESASENENRLDLDNWRSKSRSIRSRKNSGWAMIFSAILAAMSPATPEKILLEKAKRWRFLILNFLFGKLHETIGFFSSFSV